MSFGGVWIEQRFGLLVAFEVAEEAAKDSCDIGIDDGDGLIVSERADGRGGILSNAREGSKLFVTFRKPMRAEFGGGVEVAGTPIVAQTAPEGQYLIKRSLCEVGEGWEVAQETVVILFDTLHLGLLKHDLTDIDFVGVSRLAPWKVVAPMAFEPVKKR